jgi:hypothetical protein
MNDFWGNKRLNQFSLNQKHHLDGTEVLIAVGSLSISGGTNLIINYAKELKNSGANVTLGYLHGSNKDADWHSDLEGITVGLLDSFTSNFYDLGIATWWPTVNRILNIECARYLYFVQSLESRFALNYANQDDKYHAAATYMIGMPVVTVASWLQNLIQSQTPSKAWSVINGVDKEIFPVASTISATMTNDLRILVEGPLDVPMKAINETLQSLSSVDGVEVWHVTPNLMKSAYAHVTLNQLPISKMYDVYRQVDVLVKMSRVEGMFGPPLEAFHAGSTAIVSKVTGYDEYISHEINSLVVEVDDFAQMRSYVETLRDNRNLLDALKTNARVTAEKWPSKEYSARVFASICYSVLTSRNLGKLNRREKQFELESLTNNRIFPMALLGE